MSEEKHAIRTPLCSDLKQVQQTLRRYKEKDISADEAIFEQGDKDEYGDFKEKVIDYGTFTVTEKQDISLSHEQLYFFRDVGVEHATIEDINTSSRGECSVGQSSSEKQEGGSDHLFEQTWQRDGEISPYDEEFLIKGIQVFNISTDSSETQQEIFARSFNESLSSDAFRRKTQEEYESNIYSKCSSTIGLSGLSSDEIIEANREIFRRGSVIIEHCSKDIAEKGCEQITESGACAYMVNRSVPHRHHLNVFAKDTKIDFITALGCIVALVLFAKTIFVFADAMIFKLKKGDCHALCGMEELPLNIIAISIAMSWKRIPKDDLWVIKKMAERHARIEAIAIGEHSKVKIKRTACIIYKSLYKMKNSFFMNEFKEAKIEFNKQRGEYGDEDLLLDEIRTSSLEDLSEESRSLIQ